MDIRIAGHQIDTGAALKEHVEARLGAIADKYFSRAVSAQVTFSKGPRDHGFACDIVAHVMQGVVLKSASQGQEARPCFDVAAEKIEKQLRRHMRKLHDHHGRAERELEAGYTVFEGALDSAADDVEETGDAPVVVAETRVDVPETSVSNAVLMLDLRNTNALLFLNAGTGAYNMVYRRNDGTIGWVEPQRQ